MKRISKIDYFYKLKKNKKKWASENIEPDIGKEYYIYSWNSNRFFPRTIHEGTNYEKLEEHINRGIICR